MRVGNEPPAVHDTLLLITLCSCWVIIPPSDSYHHISNASVPYLYGLSYFPFPLHIYVNRVRMSVLILRIRRYDDMVEDKRNLKAGSKPTTQNIIIENREKLNVSGVLDVESFDDENVILHTDLGVLVVKGTELHINKLSIESGELVIEGDISSCTYTDDDISSKKLGFLGKLFR